MEIYLWSVVILSVVLACLAWWRTVQLSRLVTNLQRNEYYADNKLKTVQKELLDMVILLRLQLAQVAEGKPLDSQLIREGKLYRDVSGAQAQDLMAREGGDLQGRGLFFDVRTPKEYAVKHISGAKLLPLEELERRFREEIPTTTPSVIVYCSNGERSRLSCEFLSRQGYTNIFNLHEGLNQWEGPTEGESPLSLVRIQSSKKRAENLACDSP